MGINRHLRQDVTVWTLEPDGYGGYTVASGPTVIKGRWEDRQEKYFTENGEELVSKAVVFFDQDIDPDSYLAEGDLSGTPDPQANGVKAYRVQAIKKIPDIRNVRVLRQVML